MNWKQRIVIFAVAGILVAVMAVYIEREYRFGGVQINKYCCADKHADNIQRNFKILRRGEYNNLSTALNEIINFYNTNNIKGEFSITLTK